MTSYIDLTHPIDENMPVWPGDPRPAIGHPMTLEKEFCSIQSICFNNHLGTHLDAPSHFIKGGRTVDQIPLETLVGKANILNFTDKGKNDRITDGDIRKQKPYFEEGARLLIKTGWDKNFRPVEFHDRFPCLTQDAASYLASLKIVLLGMDTPSPGPVDDPCQEIHRTLLGADVVLVEALKNLTMIEKSECHLVVLPPLFKNFSGAPCRAMAILQD